jgi:hypothetical protein
MYKVRTNQIDVPFAQLESAARNIAVESAVATLRREAQMAQSAKPAPVPRFLAAAPVLKPTAYSSRFIYADAGESSTSTLPSSPPVEQAEAMLASAAEGEDDTTPRASRGGDRVDSRPLAEA